MLDAELWMLYIIFAVIAVIAELFAPAFFCINFAFAGIITAFISIFWGDIYITLAIYIALSVVSIIFIKPVLVKKFKKGANADFDEQYKGRTAKVIETVTCTSGAVSIFDERWEARIKEGSENIEAGCDARITGNDSLVLFVEKV